MHVGGRAKLAAWGLLAAAATGGCSAKVTVLQYPSFYDPQLKSVAVVAFENDSLHPRAGEYLANRLAEKLKANGTYETVIGPKELNARLFEANETLPPNAGAQTVAAALRKLGGVQAFVTGKVKAFAADRGSYVEVDDWYGGGGWGHGWRGRRRGYHGYGWGMSFPIYRRYSWSEAHVAATAALIRTADAKPIHATPRAVRVRMRSTAEPLLLADEILAAGADAAAERLLEAFAVVPKQLKLNKGKTLRTARRGKSGKLKFTGDFRPDEEEMHVVVRLPKAADRNSFRIAITRKGDEDVLAEKPFTWSAERESQGFVFSPRALFETGGTEDFEVRLYSGEELVLKKKFEIEP